MVVCIVGILGMLAMPRFHSMLTQSKLNASASELYAALVYAEELAVRYQRPFGVRADVAGNWFRVFDNRYKAGSEPTPSPKTRPWMPTASFSTPWTRNGT